MRSSGHDVHPSSAGDEQVLHVGSQSTHALLYKILSAIQEVHVVRFVSHDLQGEVQSVQVSPCFNLPLAQAVQVVALPSQRRQLASQDLHWFTVSSSHFESKQEVQLSVAFTHVLQFESQSTQTLLVSGVIVLPSGQVVGTAQVSFAVRTLSSLQLVHLSIRLTQSRHADEHAVHTSGSSSVRTNSLGQS